jgi:DNA-directed RNA polymerase subunit A'
MSMMAHEIRVMPGRTFRFNLAVCTPYNADFDGDEMNLHVIQGEEARAEARILMRVQEHILSPRYGGSIIGGIHDHISGAYLLTRPGATVDKTVGMDILGRIDYTGPLPKEIKRADGSPGFNGADLIGLIVPKNIMLRFRSRSNDDVVIDAGTVVGTLDKRAIGAEDGRLLDAVVQTNGPTEGAKFLDDMTRLTIGACTALGFTTGIDDEDLPPEALAEIERINSEARAMVDDELKRFGKDGRGYETRPGRTPLETMEDNIMVILDEGKAITGDIARVSLTERSEDNAAVIMATSGARGSMDNLTMMAGSIGQVKVDSARLERGYKDRVLPHFPRGLKGAREKGFISSSFKRGLEPTEFFMLSMAGRYNLAVQSMCVSKSGYMQRRLINAMDDLKVFKDEKLSVRNTADRIIQFEYGEDGIDPWRSVHGMPVNTDVIIDKVFGTKSKANY